MPTVSFSIRIPVVAVLFLAVCLAGSAQSYSDFTIPRPLPPNSYLVIGMLGGIERWNAENRPVRQLALRLRDQRIPNVYVETIEHEHKNLAVRLIRDALDTNRDGKLDAAERSSVRVILYGHSMGAASVVSLARKLEKLGVPVRLTIQVDSIGSGAGTIPPNVARAANFYQHDSVLLHGRDKIRAQDPSRTEILGNFRYDYDHKDIDLSRITAAERIAGGAHTKMEFDPDVWSVVEKLILKELNR